MAMKPVQFVVFVGITKKKNIYVAKEEGIFGSSPTFWCSICKARHILPPRFAGADKPKEKRK
jgi:hypothetical protein